MTVFIDSSALFAILDRDDSAHATASRIWRNLIAQNEHCLISNYVLLETNALIQRRLGMVFVHIFEDKLVPFLNIVWVEAGLHQVGLQMLRMANRRQLSLVDCVSFAVCQQANIRTVFAFDEHFAERGFHLLDSP